MHTPVSRGSQGMSSPPSPLLPPRTTVREQGTQRTPQTDTPGNVQRGYTPKRQPSWDRPTPPQYRPLQRERKRSNLQSPKRRRMPCSVNISETPLQQSTQHSLGGIPPDASGWKIGFQKCGVRCLAMVLKSLSRCFQGECKPSITQGGLANDGPGSQRELMLTIWTYLTTYLVWNRLSGGIPSLKSILSEFRRPSALN